MKTYIQPETKYVNINSGSLMDEEMPIVSGGEKVTDPDEILSNENSTWEEEIPQQKSIWE